MRETIVMDQTFVSLDLETTGLSPEGDAIIEVGAIKFRGPQLLETLCSLANPKRPLPIRIQALTGISDSELKGAPPFSALSGKLAAFIGNHPLVGHNLPFDLAFLSRNGLPLSNPFCDTRDLAAILLPHLADRSLPSVAAALSVPCPVKHRALPDAATARGVFLKLLELALELDLFTISQIVQLTAQSTWPMRHLFRDLERAKARVALSEGKRVRPEAGGDGLGLLLPPSPFGATLSLPKGTPGKKRLLDIDALSAILGEGGPLSRAFPGYEFRPEQLRMTQAVAKAFNEGRHLVVEAGTGTGKSIAYLLPSLALALQQGTHVVISTNTINLQEQLLNKDIPGLLRALEGTDHLPPGDLRAVTLKGRGNYLCLRRWASLLRGEAASPDDMRPMVRVLTWLPSTSTGDRAELNLTAAERALWDRVCAQSEACLGARCPHQQRGHCFLHRARRAAEQAHIIVVNHALLLSDLATESKVLPEYSHLVIDEAHHLEEEATEQFGFRATERDIARYLDRLGQGRGELLAEVKGALTPLAVTTRRHLEQTCQEVASRVDAARAHLSQFFAIVGDFVERHSQDQGDYESHLRLTRAARAQPAWSEVEIAWENLSLALGEVEGVLGRLASGLSDLSGHLAEAEDMVQELSSVMSYLSELRCQMNGLVSNPEPERIYWASLDARGSALRQAQGGAVTLCAAPLHVGGLLEEKLFSAKECVVLAGATLSTEGTFEYLKERLGLEGPDELLLGSPFNYLGSTLVCIPSDVPEPGQEGHQEAVAQLLIEACRASRGRALALFTSHAALRAAYSAIGPSLEAEGIAVLGQGIDGPPAQLLAAFRGGQASVLLGAASLWEGVDVVGEALSLLVVARLPFSVPTEPVFAARAETFSDSFNQYALPQAVLRFKQGFGRLIRSKTDRGVVVILDRRLQSRSYGQAFLNSVPPCTVVSGPWRRLAPRMAAWLGEYTSPPDPTKGDSHSTES